MIGLVLSVAFGILIGFIRRGSLKTFGEAQLRAMPIVFAGVVFQLGATIADANDLRWLGFALVLASFACVFTFAAMNFRLPGMTLIALGALCNFLVIAANGGMPVSLDALDRAGLGNPFAQDASGLKGAHHALTDSSNLRFLADIIPITVGSGNVASIGDVLIWAGLLLLIQQMMVGPRGKRRRGTTQAVSARSERD